MTNWMDALPYGKVCINDEPGLNMLTWTNFTEKSTLVSNLLENYFSMRKHTANGKMTVGWGFIHIYDHCFIFKHILPRNHWANQIQIACSGPAWA